MTTSAKPGCICGQKSSHLPHQNRGDKINARPSGTAPFLLHPQNLNTPLDWRISELPLKGEWLNLAAGDGRYTQELLDKVDSLTAVDIDGAALKKLKAHVSGRDTVLKTQIADITKKLPFQDHSFDGVLCTGSLHLFSKSVLRKIFPEIHRVLKQSGKFVIDFAVDIKRQYQNPTAGAKKIKPNYTLRSAKALLETLLKDYNIQMYTSEFADDVSNIEEFGFITKGKFILVVGEKR